MPLRTEDQRKDDSTTKKFQFRWAGPLRVIGHSSDHNRFTLVEMLHDGRLLSRIANAARMRPFTPLPPLDSADDVSDGVSDYFAREIEMWKNLK
ncbi:hypothetical protein HDU67_002678, partial [Dinochytrium kinnereticum]